MEKDIIITFPLRRKRKRSTPKHGKVFSNLNLELFGVNMTF